MSDVNELAIKYANAVDDPENASWHTRYSSFKYAYQKAREDLMSQASEEHKDWYFKNQNPMRDLEKYPINEIEQTDLYYLTSLKIWQNAKLSSLKEIRETKEACSLIVAQKLKEIEKLKSQLAQAEECILMISGNCEDRDDFTYCRFARDFLVHRDKTTPGGGLKDD